jgi:hypothetical protein
VTVYSKASSEIVIYKYMCIIDFVNLMVHWESLKGFSGAFVDMYDFRRVFKT